MYFSLIEIECYEWFSASPTVMYVKEVSNMQENATVDMANQNLMTFKHRTL